MIRHGLGLAFFLLLIAGFASATTNISACGYLNGDNTEFTLNQSIDNGGVGNCITFNGTNQSLDCMGFSINASETNMGVYSAFNSSKINNCTINSASFVGMRLNGANSAQINNSYIYASGAFAFQLTAGDFLTMQNTQVRGWGGISISGSHGRYTNVIGNATFSGYNGIILSDLTANNTFSGCTAVASGYEGIQFSRSSNNTFSGGTISGNQATYGAVLFYDGSTGNTLANSTINAMGTKGITFKSISSVGRHADGNTVFNNTIKNASISIEIDSISSNNTFVFNNLSNTGKTPDAYVNDSNGANNYNTTVSSKNQGNIYANVIDGSVIVSGTNNSSVTGLLIGNVGAGYPYNEINSGGKFICAAPCGDYAPLTATTTNTSASLSSPSLGAPIFVFSVASCSNGTFVNANGNPENTSSRKWAWYVNGTEVSGATSQTFAVSLYGLAPGAVVSCSENTTASGVAASYAYNTSNNVTISDFSGGTPSGSTGSSGSPMQTIVINGTNQSTQNLPTPSSFSDISKGTDEFLKSQTAGVSNAGLVILGLLVFLWRGKGDGTGGFTSLIALFSIAIIYFYYSKYIFGG